ncbi:hypothetical protein REB14_03520 [Chryseobacterium sp. ES2]|uniref:Uncharacterized protein n=1 Tax=Chryseobacterium metallicongregator TaxID=3073042 RepID=A0ABU1E0D6_9FLAO|nr:hypothetical protein [Chryseobacterium sp. ES2]MDR4951254.1 hypothetical protein [Chryseobacterium sp. ES2]
MEKGTRDPEKAKAADIFYKKRKEAEKNQKYTQLKKIWKEKYGEIVLTALLYSLF